MSEQIRLTEVVKHRLERYRDDHGHNSMDSAVREIMMRADIDIYEYQDEMEEEDDETDLADKMGWDE